MQCEAVLLGRQPVDGAIDASSLASLIRSLFPATRSTVVTRGWTTTRDERPDRRYILRCRDGLEIVKRPFHQKHQLKRHDDEGFESDGDDDSASTRSLGSSADDTMSNSSSCCFVDDHVFKCHPNATITTLSGRPTPSTRVISSSTSSCVSSVATDSANSSGASDTEDTSVPSTPSPTAVNTTSVSALVKSLSLFQQRNGKMATSKISSPVTTNKDGYDDTRETYAVNEIAFCHTDPSFQRIVVWVVKKRRSQRLSPSGTDTSSGLEAIVFECSSEEKMKKLCESFHETSRRVKLEQYRHPHRRKDPSLASSREHSSIKCSSLTPESIIKALKEASQKSSTLAAITKPVTKPIRAPTTRTLSNGSGPGSEVEVLSTVAGTRFNLVQRTDGDGVTHIEVSRGLQTENPVENLIALDDQNLDGPSSIISISTPDVGNLLSANSNTGTKSRFCKEIEGIIRSDVDVGGTRKEVIQRQRQPAILVIHSGNADDDSGGELRKVWSPPTSTVPQTSMEDDETNPNSSGPQRPERKRYTRRNKAPAPQPPSLSSHLTKGPHQLDSVSNKKSPSTKSQSDSNAAAMPQKRVNSNNSNNNNQQMVVRGQFIRVSVDQQQPQPTMVVPVIQQGAWIYGNGVANGNLVAYSPAPPSWRMSSTASQKSSSNKNHAKKNNVEDSFSSSSTTTQHQQQAQTQQHFRKNRSRSRNVTNGSRRSKSPPARRPMAYRYIDTVPASNTANSLSNRFFGLSQKLREIGGAVVHSSSPPLSYNKTGRRRNSIGELPARFEYIGEGCGGEPEGKNGGNLKSVIKKNRRIGEYSEPKKVTFSAYATVQVVD